MIALDDSRLTKRVFPYDYRQCKNNWCSKIKQFFEEINLLDTFNRQQPVDIFQIIAILNEKSENTWHLLTNKKPKLRTYCTFKTTLEVENYAKFCKSRMKRSLLAKFC